MPEWLINLISKLKPSALTSCGLLISCSLLLFIPHDFIVFLGLNEFTKEQRPWIGITWLISTSFCTVYFFKMIAPSITELANSLSIKYHRAKIIRNLTSDQKALLSDFKLNGWKENRLDVNSAAVNQLIHLTIIDVPARQITPYVSDGSQFGRVFVSDWARKYLDKYPKRLGINRLESN
jgi:hypothetical protein